VSFSLSLKEKNDIKQFVYCKNQWSIYGYQFAGARKIFSHFFMFTYSLSLLSLLVLFPPDGNTVNYIEIEQPIMYFAFQLRVQQQMIDLSNLFTT
jgi:hypothetical protein